MNWFRDLSLKFKLIFLLVLLTGSMLLVYGGLALRDFEKDKIAYVLDTSLAHSRSAALQMRAEIGYVVDRVKFFMRGYDYLNKTFHPYSANVFTQESNFLSIQAFHLDANTNSYVPQNALRSTRATDADLSDAQRAALNLVPQVLENEMTIFKLNNGTQWLLGLKFEQTGHSPALIFVAVESGHFMSFFQTKQMQDTYLVDAKGQIAMAPSAVAYSMNAESLKNAIAQALAKTKSPEGSYQYHDKKTGTWLIALSNVDFGQMKIISAVPRNAALEAVKLIMVKSALFLGLLLCVTIFLSVISSTSLTASLKRLLLATSEIAKGNFEIQVPIQSRDEIGSLSSGFNRMANEISRLMLETAEKARMESELNTARLVQSTLFPKPSFTENEIEIQGFYQPASECSGDWWYYKKIGNQTLFCIADATGHGVPAALLTAAARSAASAIEVFPQLSLNEIMTIFNKAIYNTANGQVMMTLFLGSYNHETGKISYCNASHEPPFLMPHKEEIKKKDIQLLNEALGPRLGEKLESTYNVSTIDIAPGDRILLYTDGVTELKNENGEMWGERALVKLLLNECNNKMTVLHTVDRISSELAAFRKEHPLHDDVTYFMLAKQKQDA